MGSELAEPLAVYEGEVTVVSEPAGTVRLDGLPGMPWAERWLTDALRPVLRLGGASARVRITVEEVETDAPTVPPRVYPNTSPIVSRQKRPDLVLDGEDGFCDRARHRWTDGVWRSILRSAGGGRGVMGKLPDDEMRDRYGTYWPKPVPDLRDSRIADLERRLAESEAAKALAIEETLHAFTQTVQVGKQRELWQQKAAELEEKQAVLTDRYHKLNAHAKALREERDKVEAACTGMRAALEEIEDQWPVMQTYEMGDLAMTALATDAGRLAARPTLFRLGEVALHSGGTGNFKIDCDALTDADWDCLAAIVAERVVFGAVVGVPTGGIRWASALAAYATSGPTLIVDDVLTTGASIEDARKRHPDAIGVVLFARGTCPDWVTPVFEMWPGRLAAEVLAAADAWVGQRGASEDDLVGRLYASVETWRKGGGA